LIVKQSGGRLEEGYMREIGSNPATNLNWEIKRFCLDKALESYKVNQSNSIVELAKQIQEYLTAY
jgi:hypothetical protein